MKPISGNPLNGIDRKPGSSDIYTMDSKKFASELFSRFIPVWIWIALAVIVTLGIIAGFFDIRLIIIAFLIVLIVFPAIVGFLYYSYALSRECFINRIPHSVRIADDSLEVTLYIKESQDESQDESEEDNEESYRTRKEIFSPGNIGKLKINTDGAFLTINDRHKGFLFIPYEAFEYKGDFITLTKRLKSIYDENIKRQS